MSSLLYRLLVITCLFVSSTVSLEEQLLPGYKEEVHIISGVLSNPAEPLRLRCQSGDTDFGLHTLQRGEEFFWRFGLNIFGRTLYFCHFYWGAANRTFNVFDEHLVKNHYCDRPTSVSRYKCYWMAKPDGFYVSNGQSPWLKLYDWSP